jgi:hypothetical protein
MKGMPLVLICQLQIPCANRLRTHYSLCVLSRTPCPRQRNAKAKKGATNLKLALDRKRLQVALSVAMQKVADQAPPPAEVMTRISAADLAAISKRVAKDMMPLFDAKINVAMQKAVKEGVKAAHLSIDIFSSWLTEWPRR